MSDDQPTVTAARPARAAGCWANPGGVELAGARASVEVDQIAVVALLVVREKTVATPGRPARSYRRANSVSLDPAPVVAAVTPQLVASSHSSPGSATPLPHVTGGTGVMMGSSPPPLCAELPPAPAAPPWVPAGTGGGSRRRSLVVASSHAAVAPTIAAATSQATERVPRPPRASRLFPRATLNTSSCSGRHSAPRPDEDTALARISPLR